MKTFFLFSTIIAGSILFFTPNECLAQFAGSRGGVLTTPTTQVNDFRPLELEVANSYITVEGRSEVRINPTQIRIVLAVISDDESSLGCGEKIRATIDTVTKSWQELGVVEDDINEDFIAVLPIYEWKIAGNVAKETKTGYRMQTNLHIKVPDEDQAMKVLEAGFSAGITDIIAFDYWSEEIEKAKATALKNAISAAKSKAEIMLAVFDEKPPVINIHEKTETIFPSNLYKSFNNVYENTAHRPNRRDVTFLTAHRPKNTYYEGLRADIDSGNSELAMKRQISILSHVRVYYRSPGTKPIHKPKG